MTHIVPGCNPDPRTVCDSGLRWEQQHLADIFHTPPGFRATVVHCGVCGKVLASPAELLTVIGEV